MVRGRGRVCLSLWGNSYPTTAAEFLFVKGSARECVARGMLCFRRSFRVQIGFLHLPQIREGITRLTTLILGSNSVVQGALPRILKETPQSYYDTLNATLQENAHSLMQHISRIPGLVPVKPSGAMYLMVGVDLGSFPSIEDDLQFSERLLEEESVSVLPGQCFGMPNFFRIVTCPPLPVLEEACERLAVFCARHKSPDV